MKYFMNSRKEIKKKQMYYFLFIILIIVSCIWNIDKAVMPYCVSDEIGYWTAAAWMNGFDWSPLMSHSQYYGWGYGLLLSVIFRIPDPVLRFRIAIIINAFLLVFVFIILSKSCNLLFKDMDEKVNIFIAGMATCYSYNILFAHTNMCEVFLTFLFALNVYIFLKVVEKPKPIYFFEIGILIFLQFATHLRMIVCIVALIITIILLGFMRKINKKKIIIITLFCLSTVLIVYFVKDLLVKGEYTSSYVAERLTGNEGIVKHLSIFRAAFSLEFWHKLFFSLEGKIFYLLCSTSFFIIGALGYMLNNIKQYIIDKRLDEERVEDAYLSIKIYICLCFFGALAVDAIYALNPYRIDAVLYGRYVENLLPVLICIGCYWVIKNNNHKKIFLIIIFLFSFLGKITLVHLNNLGIKISSPVHIAWFLGWLSQDRLSNYFYYTIYPLLISGCLAVVFVFLSRRNIRLACILISISWIISAENGWLNIVTPQLDRMNEIIDVAYKMKQYDEPYLCVIPESLATDTDEFVDVSWLQYQLGTSTLYEITAEEIVQRTEDFYFLVNKENKNYDLYTQGKTILWSNSRFSIVEYQVNE